MKKSSIIKSIMLATVMLANINCYSQYKSLFGNEHTSWNVKITELDGYSLDSIVYEKDTIMFDTEYKKFKYFRGYYIMDIIFITENLNTGKASYKYKPYREHDIWEEYQIYDMSLNEGDIYNHDRTNIVVDHTEVHDGVKYIYFDHYVNTVDSIKLVMIEGVGTNIGIAYHSTVPLGCIMPVLLCQEKDGVKTYVNDYGIYSGQCNLDSIHVSVEVESGNKINIYPNPANDMITISDACGADVTVINILGEEVLKLKNISENQNIDLADFKPGTYYIRIVKDNRLYIDKVVKL